MTTREDILKERKSIPNRVKANRKSSKGYDLFKIIIGAFAGAFAIYLFGFLPQKEMVVKLKLDNIQLQLESQSIDNQKMIWEKEISELQTQLKNKDNEIIKSKGPDIEYQNKALFIDGEEYPINQTNSFVTIDSKKYYSVDFLNALVPEGSEISVQENAIYIGKIIATSEKLSDQWVVDSKYMKKQDSVVDSFGLVHSDVFVSSHDTEDSTVIFSLNEKFSMLKANLYVEKGGNRDSKGYIEIWADGVSVYKNEDIELTTSKIPIDVPINNAKLLTIKCTNTPFKKLHLILGDSVVYNQK